MRAARLPRRLTMRNGWFESMSISERFKIWRRREAEKLKTMSFSQKLAYLFAYYKGWLAAFLVAILFAAYIGDAVVQAHKETVLQGFFTNDEYDLFPAGKLQKDFASRLGLEKNQRILFDDDLFVDLTGGASQYTAASNGKIIANMAVGELDFIVTSKEVYEHYSGQVPMRDLKTLLPAELYEALSPYMTAGKDETGAEISAALEMSQSRFLRDADYVEEGSYYLFVPYSAPHTEPLCAFIAYCFE